MTTIVGIQGSGWSVLGTDSKITSFDDSGLAFQTTILPAGSSKIAQNGRYLLGAAGDVRAINLLQHVFRPPSADKNLVGRKLDQFVTSKFIPALRSLFEEHGYASPDNDRKHHIAEHDSTIVLAVNATIYIIDSDYSWSNDQTGFYALGTGASYAMGAIHALTAKRQIHSAAQAKTIATKALQIAGRLDPHTGGPVQTYSQTSAR